MFIPLSSHDDINIVINRVPIQIMAKKETIYRENLEMGKKFGKIDFLPFDVSMG